MKKLLVMVLMAVMASASIASATTILTNYPVGSTSPDLPVGAAVNATVGNLALGATQFSVSTFVKLVATGNSGGYNVASKHKAGDTHYLSSSVASGIQETAGTKGTDMVSTQIVSTVTGQFYTGI